MIISVPLNELIQHMKKATSIFIAALFLFAKASQAQLLENKTYPQGYFQWPVGSKPALVANFGELRPNHYHMGLDCRTEERENLPIYAAAEGYIAKVKIEPFGFGRAIYINHPNGLTTLYAHLNKFFPALEKYITDQQYKQEKWKVFIDLPLNLFKVAKGDFIAMSGNTGGSQGPHLHFEIRDTKTDKVLNPLLFGFPIEDNIAPDVLRLAVYDRRLSTYEQTPKIYSVKKVNGVYKPIGNISSFSDKVSFAITSFDRYTGSTNQNGIYKAELFDNEKPVVGFEMDSITYDETRCLNGHIDFKTRTNGGPHLQHLSQLPGYTNGIYKTAPGADGIIDLSDNSAHEIKITVSDANNNVSVLSFMIHKDNSHPATMLKTSGQKFIPGNINIFENNSISFYLNEHSIFDSFDFIYHEIIPKIGRPIYQLQNNNVPVFQYFPIKIKDFFSSKDTGRIIMKRSWNNKIDYKKTTFENNWYKASFRSFGYFQLILDTMPPAIRPLGKFKDGANVSNQSSIAFLITDNTEEIDQFIALLDDKWICFSNDKGKVFTYSFDDHCLLGDHTLKIIATDLAGNKTEKIYHFTR